MALVFGFNDCPCSLASFVVKPLYSGQFLSVPTLDKNSKSVSCPSFGNIMAAEDFKSEYLYPGALFWNLNSL